MIHTNKKGPPGTHHDTRHGSNTSNGVKTEGGTVLYHGGYSAGLPVLVPVTLRHPVTNHLFVYLSCMQVPSSGELGASLHLTNLACETVAMETDRYPTGSRVDVWWSGDEVQLQTEIFIRHNVFEGSVKVHLDKSIKLT